MVAEDYVRLNGFSRSPDGLTSGSAYTANHALHGSLGNNPSDGFATENFGGHLGG